MMRLWKIEDEVVMELVGYTVHACVVSLLHQGKNKIFGHAETLSVSLATILYRRGTMYRYTGSSIKQTGVFVQ